MKSTMTTNGVKSTSLEAKDRQRKQQLLKEQIAKEERLVRIYQAELWLARQQRQQERSTQPTIIETTTEEADWLETLDALQSNFSTTIDGTPKIDSQWHDDPTIFRLLPLIGGVAFTSVEALPMSTSSILPSSFNDPSYRSYELKGHVCAPQATDFVFSILAKVEIIHMVESSSERARLVNVQAQLSGPTTTTTATNYKDWVPNDEELNQVSLVASQTCNLPLLFRQLTALAEFDWKRQMFLEKCHDRYGRNFLKRISSHTFEIHVWKTRVAPTAPGLSLTASWRWECDWDGRGREELKILDCVVSSYVLQNTTYATLDLHQWLRDIRDPQALHDLLECTGSCEAAIDLMIQSLLKNANGTIDIT